MDFLQTKTMIITVLLIGLCSISNVAQSVPNTNITSVLCNSGIYTRGDPFAISLAYVLNELTTKTPAKQGYNYKNISPYPNAFAYGHATCNQNLTSTDCKKCLDAAEFQMLSNCNDRIGARAVLNDCSIRYEQYPFDD
ncbi:antifungal protein ginkbilobin-like protein [Bidens hawaiensis]|uniref:antifungal protein ginkbilobin-like protein n=1 Tax=Bidens hawaiensis TaxID=980011 RepID=UPI00404B1405